MKRTGLVGVLVAFVLILTGCSTLHYTAQDRPMVNFKDCSNSGASFSYEQRYDFWWWGLAPDVMEVDVTAIAKENGAPYGICDVRIEEKYTVMDCVLGMVTLGIYSPRTVIVEGKKIGVGGQ